jgi:hypothetical protein
MKCSTVTPILTSESRFPAANNRPNPFVRLFALAMAFSCLQAQATESRPLFENAWLIEATIRAPIGTIMKNRSEEEEFEGTFTYKTLSGEQQELKLKVQIRGHFRADKKICDFGPLRLNFKKKQVAGTEFAGQDKLKLVTHCQNKNPTYEQLMLKEYLTYKMFSSVTENAFRVRLLKITYIDSEGNSSNRTHYSFLIEHRKKLAARIEMEPGNAESITFSQLDNPQTNLVTVYSYLIGNTDFSAVLGPKQDRCCHNVELFKNSNDQYVPIPYDFDFSGMVDAPYAAPNSRFDIDKVTERKYRGLCKNNDLLENSFTLFNESQAEILSMIENFDPLVGVARNQMKRYVKRFYKDISNDGKVQKYFVKECSNATAPPTAS